MEMFFPMVSAVSMLTTKPSHPSSVRILKRLFSDRLVSTCCHPLSSWKKGTRINKTSVPQSEGGEVCIRMCM